MSEQDQAQTEVKPPTVKPTIALDETRALAPRDARELAMILERIAEGGGFPARFDSAAKRIAAYNMAHSLMGPRWQLALNNIAVIKGQMTIYGELPGAIAEMTGEVEEKYTFLVDRTYNEISLANKNLDVPAWAAVCRIKRKGRAVKEFYFTLDEAEKAGLYPPIKRDGSVAEDSPWMKFTKIMLARRAQATALKFEFPDALLAIPIAEYDLNSAPDLTKDVTPRKSRIADELNSEYLNKKEADQGQDSVATGSH